MGDKSGLCLWCGRFTELKAPDGLADCDRHECIAKRDYAPEDPVSAHALVILENL